MPGKTHGPTTTKAPPAMAYGATLHQLKPKHPHAVSTTYQACHYMYAGRLKNDLQLDVGSRVLHVDYLEHDDVVFVLRDGQWVDAGELHVDVDCYIEGEDISLGRFHLSKGLLGDFEGPWVWNYGAPEAGRGVGLDKRGANVTEITVDFLLEAPPGLPPDPQPSAKHPGVPGYDEVFYLTLTVS